MAKCTCLNIVKRLNVILASQSPRRYDILINRLGIDENKLKVILPVYEEGSEFTVKDVDKDTVDYVSTNAKGKCQAVARQVHSSDHNLIIAADTVVTHEGHLLEKPKDTDDAYNMLKKLSGCQHEVSTGVAVMCYDKTRRPTLVSFCEKSFVTFANLSDDDIEAYIQTREPMDKAGSYGIQGYGSHLISKVDGCFFNVEGLPTHRLSQTIQSLYDSGCLAV